MKSERGAIVTGAAISLSVFMFFMFTMYTLIDIAYTQARVSVALDSVTKQLAEYSNAYFASGLDKTFSGSGGKSSEVANQISEFLIELGGDVGTGEIAALLNDAGSAIKGDSLTTLIKHGVGETLVSSMLKNNLGDDFIKNNRIQGGFNTSQCQFLQNGNEIFMGITYKVKVIRLLNIDITFNLGSCSYTKAWSGE